MTAVFNRAGKQVLAQFRQPLGKRTLKVSVYWEVDAYVCERALVEADGSIYTQTLPILSLDDVTALLQNDVFYRDIRVRADFLLVRLAEKLRDGNTHASH